MSRELFAGELVEWDDIVSVEHDCPAIEVPMGGPYSPTQLMPGTVDTITVTLKNGRVLIQTVNIKTGKVVTD